jgi:predicted dehydrogenase/threonine dehydrogenase-like Zn-dependent dehydrogenase
MSQSLGQRTKQFANRAANRGLDRLGIDAARSLDIKREAWWWLGARGQAFSRQSRLLEARAIVWTTRLRAELLTVEVPAAGPGEVTIEVLDSVISPGTERAQYLGSPNARVAWNHRPGFAVAGRVLMVGDGVTRFERGQWVAASGATHQSVVTIDASRVYPIPSGLPSSDAALLHFGLISGQGVRLAAIPPEEPFVLIGAGIIGLLAQRMAQACGAGPATVIAASRRKEQHATLGGAKRFLALSEDAHEIASTRAKIVIEATGDPAAVGLAVNIAEPGGRIVLLGSARGRPHRLPLEELRQRQLALVGAHVGTLELEERRSGEPLRTKIAETFLDDLVRGRLTVRDLVDRVKDPREADDVYRQLAYDPSFVGARFDWRRLDRPERVRGGRWLQLPNLQGRGVVPTAPQARPPGGRRAPAFPETSSFDGRRDLSRKGPPLRLALVGCGEIATANAAAAAMAGGVELVGFYDLDRALAVDLADDHGGWVAASVDELLSRSDVDAIFVSVPHHLHAPLTISGLEAGKHVIVEKPPANDLAGALRMREAAERTGSTLSVCFPNRYDHGAVAAKALLEQGVLGTFHGAQIIAMDDKPASYLHGGFSGRSASTWRASRERAGGGVLIMNLVHSIDLLRHLAPAPVTEVQAVMASQDWPAEVEDTISVILRFDDGAVATLLGCVSVRGLARHQEEFRLWGSRGHLEILPNPQVYTSVPIDGIQPVRWHQIGTEESVVPTRQVFLENFARAIALDEPPDVAIDGSVEVQAIIEAAYRSASMGAPVRVRDLLEELYQ